MKNGMYPLISVIVPVYNTEKYVARCIESIINQTYTNLEIIVVDDGSTDLSFSICCMLRSKDCRIKLVTQQNSGASIARNVGLESAHGDYIMFVDSDDYIDKVMVDHLYCVMQQLSPSFVVTKIPYDKKSYSSSKLINRDETLQQLLSGVWWGPIGKLIKREVIGDIRFPEHTISEDYLFNVQMAMQCDKVFYLDRMYYHREIRNESLSRLPICERKFDEYYNVRSVSELIADKYPIFSALADSNYIGTILKLLFAVYNANQDKRYKQKIAILTKAVRQKYCSFIRNKEIMDKQRLMISFCFSYISSRCFYTLYSLANRASRFK